MGVGVISVKLLSLARGPRPPSQVSLALELPLASVKHPPAPKALYLNSFLATEQLEGSAAALGEAGDLEIKCWRPPLSLLGKRLGLKTELY